MNDQNTIPIATTHIFVNVPKHLNHSISAGLLSDVEEQVLSQYLERFQGSGLADLGLEVCRVSTRRGCLVVEITIGASAIAIPSILAAIKGYKPLKESLFEIGSDVKHIWFKTKHLKSTKTACVMKIELETEKAIEDAIKDLEQRRRNDT